MIDNTPIWRIYKPAGGRYRPVLDAWYMDHIDENFLTAREFGTKAQAEKWLKEFWECYWRLL